MGTPKFCSTLPVHDGRLRPTLVFDEVKTRIVFEAEIRAVDPEGLSFINIDTPEESQTA